MQRKRFLFGEWQVDPNTNTLLHCGITHRVEPLAMNVLYYLCKNHKKVVSTEELLKICWGDNALPDNFVHKIINQLRRVFGDSFVNPRYIETVRKRGYRSIATLVFPSLTIDDRNQEKKEKLEGVTAYYANLFGLFNLFSQLKINATTWVVLAPANHFAAQNNKIKYKENIVLFPIEIAIDKNCLLYFNCCDIGEVKILDAFGSVLLDAEMDGRLIFEKESAASLGQRLIKKVNTVIEQLQLEKIFLIFQIDNFDVFGQQFVGNSRAQIRFIKILEQLTASGCASVCFSSKYIN